MENTPLSDNISSSQKNNSEPEIDLVDIIRNLWRNRKFILKVAGVFIILGILVAISSSTEYTAGCIMVPQSADKKMGGGLSGLAAMAGINLSDVGAGEVLSPKMYPKILESVPFQKELMQTPVKFSEYAEQVRLIDYFTDDKYQKITFGGIILQYTVGLPGVIITAIRGEENDDLPVVGEGISILTLTQNEKKCIAALKNKINLTVNDKDGYVQLEVRMPEGYAAAQVAERIQQLLQKYITEFKIEKVQSNLDFVQGRYNEAKYNFEQIQENRAVFKDANKNIYSAKALTESEKWDTQYDLALNVYTELAKQLEQAKIQVKQTIPILTVVDPVTVPTERSKPKRSLIVVLFAFLGGFAGIGLVLTLPFIADISGKESLKKWIR